MAQRIELTIGEHGRTSRVKIDGVEVHATKAIITVDALEDTRIELHTYGDNPEPVVLCGTFIPDDE